MNRDELSVYADELQQNGDVRGEIIALEIQPRRPDIEARHATLMRQWLKFDPQGMPGVRFRFAFADVTADGLTRVLGTAAEHYVRSVFVAGNNSDALRVLDELTRMPRPHLERLSIMTGRRFGDPRAPTAPFVITDVLAQRLVAVTPNLAWLSLAGNRLVRELAHPTLQRLRVIGHDALASLVETGAAMPAVRELLFGFATDRYGRISFGEAGLPRTLLSRGTLPALEVLDLGANELQRTWQDGHVAIFELLSELGVLQGLRRLRVPTILANEERTALDHACEQIRALELLETGNELPGPLHDQLEPSATLTLRIENYANDFYISMRRLGELMVARWSALDDDTRAAWTELWDALAGIPLEPEDYWMYEELPPVRMQLALWREPLASLDDDVYDDFEISLLADAILRATASVIGIRRRRY